MSRIVDSDLLIVRRVSRTNGVVKIEVEWKDAQGVGLGVYSAEWGSPAEVITFLGEQDFNDVMRSLMLQCVNRATGALRPAVFDGMVGKTFEIQNRVREVV